MAANDLTHPDSFRRLLEEVVDYGVVLLDAEGRAVRWNRGAAHIYGQTSEEARGGHFSRFYPADDQQSGRPQQLLEKAQREGHASEEGWRVRADGSRFWASAVLHALRDDSGGVIGFGEITRDLTERKQFEEKLRAGEEQFRMLVDGVEEYAIYMLDPTGRVTTWNSGAQHMKGYTAAEIIGKDFSLFYTEPQRAAGRPQRNLESAKRQGSIHDRGVRVRKDGSTFQADVLITALRDKEGNIRGFSKVTRDITEQVRTREMEAAKIAAEQANKAKDEFLAALSHELRTPLTPALAAAGFLVENATQLAPDYAEQLEIIRRNIQLEARLIDDLLDLTRISRGVLHLRRTRVDAHEILGNAIEIAAPTSEEKSQDLFTELRAEKHHVLADPVRLQQVYWNLINNAVKFTGPRGCIRIRTSNEADGTFQFEIADTGVGIEPARQGSLFRAFEQASPEAQKMGGLGLGLAIAKRIVELHGGWIELESEGKDRGSIFRVRLPLAPAQSSADSKPEHDAPERQGGLRILLVEDHSDTRRALSSLLRHFGHTISIADCVQAALDAVKSEQFDAVVSDIGLPDGTGYDVIARAKKRQPLKAIALTGFGMEEDVRRSQEAGFDYHLTKPVDMAELRTVLAELSKPSED